uniref:Uncharacterized protein n=1 Tax=Podoviridae sp. ct8Lf7 TaxID=2827723 RepID=A0A8S5S1A0_9CAUD|nr:MAG TPA: hypothetical protein [Podoviridae sp. ct8Lf7]
MPIITTQRLASTLTPTGFLPCQVSIYLIITFSVLSLACLILQSLTTSFIQI